MDQDYYQSEIDSNFDDAESFDDVLDEDQNYIPNPKRRSYVWRYFSDVPGNAKVFECKICKALVGAQTCNLGRHLKTIHNLIGREKSKGIKRGRPSRSFIWKYCSRQNERQALCHLCKKLLYFGGGNTSNITKHLQRKHADVIENNGEFIMEHSSPETKRATDSIDNSHQYKSEEKKLNYDDETVQSYSQERRGTSYVWQYCQKLSKHTIRCKLCDKLMSFHGTANVITHLQRKHNVIGKADVKFEPQVERSEDTIAEKEADIVKLDEVLSSRKRPRGGGPSSLVWKYCKRISKEIVRCGFCKKNLSYQGTSNLQRHLHRMHGVVASNRSTEVDTSQLDSDAIWEHCTTVSQNKVKCNMCNEVFNTNAQDEIQKHVVGVHGVNVYNNKRKWLNSETASYDGIKIDIDDSSWEKSENIEVASVEDEQDENGLEMLYNELIVEDEDMMMEHVEDAAHNAEQENKHTIQDDSMANPLSPQSSLELLSPMHENESPYESKRMQELREERVRMQSEYFREKAAFYRMQKYLTALQAKKLRAELENINNGQYVVNVAEHETEESLEYSGVTLEMPNENDI